MGKLMDIDSEHLGIPDTEYKAVISMPAGEFQRICRDLSVLGDTCVISASKEGIRFSVSGDLDTGNITLRETSGSDEKPENTTTIEIEGGSRAYLCTSVPKLLHQGHPAVLEGIP